mmetsp:Transcript_25037/g.64633  ORF Transcript_25037/g.64633 Transcript_25037/m.64633 type:complete len:452 (-) Transcript_25037:179-1534(-)|eukprot:CAMPEP_0119414054 /NCGR_PEP_ID=MMETSP1335-20130426/6417_1 /TAXON_ID=259385 /ORGANISM="Chrysoculter rhomboideus, Strain RCC1486" /LENGTH=451 /DNA_ID=CAMNT_0007438905 /DNA_START=45 /DNA_END=1400 /DNA_ORIENTATION=+
MSSEHPAPTRKDTRQHQLRELTERVARGETLSKNAIKRLNKLQRREENRDAIKASKRQRREQRRTLEQDDLAVSLVAVPSPIGRSFSIAPSAAGARAYAFWKGVGEPRTILAPMVNQSELAFRMLARRHGAPLCFTQMLPAGVFVEQKTYRSDAFERHAADRPLIAQFCGDDPSTLVRAASCVAPYVDAVDLNCGCPQGIARRGHYGAFLLDEPDLIVDIVRHLSSALSVPVTVKLRVQPSEEATLALARRLQEAGCVMLTVHGRTREQKSRGEADWAAIARIKAALDIPVVANGGVESPEDIARCLDATGCDSVMTSEAALENPGIFGGQPCTRASQARLAEEYLDLLQVHPPPNASIIRAHLFKLLYMALTDHVDMRAAFAEAQTVEQLCVAARTVIKSEKARASADPSFNERCDRTDAPFLSWYRRHRHPAASHAPAAAELAESVDET